MSTPIAPPFTAETAAAKVRAGEDAWNGRDPAKVALAYTPDSRWRNRAEFVNAESDRKFHWPLGRRPDDHPSLSEMGF